MALWKDSNNKIHDDMNGKALALPTWPQGMTQITQADATAILNPAPTPAQIFTQAESSVQSMLDTFAQTWQYESILSAASYATSTVLKFQHEASALIAWRDQVWSACYAAMAAIQAGTQAMPVNIAAFVATLPVAPARPL
jgi:predicted NAD/FAD-dependent oxidoreductase